MKKLFYIGSTLLVMLSLFPWFSCDKHEVPSKTINTDTSSTDFIRYTINGNPINFFPPSDTVYAMCSSPVMGTGIWGRTQLPVPPNPQKTTYIFIDGTPAMNPQVLTNWGLTTNNAYYIKTPGGAAVVNTTEFGNVGQYIAGNFGFQVKDTFTNTISPMTCSFRVKRYQ